MSAHADKTLHWKISGNIIDTDTFPHIFSLEMYSSGMNSWTNLSQISCTNLSMKFVRIQIHMNFLHEKLVMLRMACTVA